MLLVLIGCAQPTPTSTGDFGAFVATRVQALGGKAPSPVPSPLQGSWTLRADTNGFEAISADIQFEQLAAYLHSAYGAPRTIGTNEVGKSGIYGATEIGVAIHFFDAGGGLQVNCVRGFGSFQEMVDAIPDR